MKRTAIESAWRGQAECTDCGIRDLVLFADLEQNDFQFIHQPIDEMYFEPGDILYHAGEEGKALFTVRTGLVKLVQYLPDGGQRIVRLLRQGDTAGLEVQLDQPYAHTAIVLRSSLTCRIPMDVVRSLSQNTPRLHNQLMKRWHQSVQQADDWLRELSTGNARARVARLLLQLKNPTGTECQLFSREDVGAMLGVTTETASRIIAEFKRNKTIIETETNRFRCDEEALKLIAGD